MSQQSSNRLVKDKRRDNEVTKSLTIAVTPQVLAEGTKVNSTTKELELLVKEQIRVATFKAMERVTGKKKKKNEIRSSVYVFRNKFSARYFESSL
jgi:hypothetical protein